MIESVTIPVPGWAAITVPVVSQSETPEGGVYVQIQLADGRYQWLKPGEYAPAIVKRAEVQNGVAYVTIEKTTPEEVAAARVAAFAMLGVTYDAMDNSARSAYSGEWVLYSQKVSK